MLELKKKNSESAHLIRPKLLYNLSHRSPLTKLLFFILSDVLIIIFSLYLSFLVHFEFNPNIRYLALIEEVFLYFIVLKILSLAVFQVYRIIWRFVGISDLVNIFLALFVAELLLLVLSLPYALLPDFDLQGLSKRIFFVDGILSFILISALRVSKRLYLEVLREKGPMNKGKNTLIIGAGNVGEMVQRDMVRNSYREYYPIGYLDDDPTKVGSSIHGVNVLAEVIRQYRVEAVVIAIPSLNYKVLRGLYDSAKKAKVGTIKIVPRIFDFSQPDINMKSLEDISIEDLVGRQTISVDYQGIGAFLRGKSILVTGAGGSIGSEIVNQICTFGPERVALFDNDETELHNQGLKLQRLYPNLWGRLDFITGDVRDEARLREAFALCRPRIVFHAAAYKHVPMMEFNPKEAVKVNIFGTFNLAGVAVEYGVEKFVMISTDKAVRPTSVMGATKRMAEHICRAFNGGAGNQDSEGMDSRFRGNDKIETGNDKIETGNDKIENGNDRRENGNDNNNICNDNNSIGSDKGEIAKGGRTRFVSVRFGNVLGSRGSVLPLFLEQLKHGGPLTVTDREMKRYFMTIPEAVSLVLQASILGNGSEVFVLDMGAPVRIVDVAEELIKLHGLEPYKDIDIKFTGLRPGEKLFEEILTAEEGTDASRHEKIYVARNSAKYSLEDLRGILPEFSAVIADPSPESNDRMKLLLRKYVKYYTNK
jgi:FlaA1/EpsC-like NDP-sugar epimerase